MTSRKSSTRKSVAAANLDIPFSNMSIGRESGIGAGRQSIQGRPSVRLSMAPSGRISMSAYAMKDTRPIKDKRLFLDSIIWLLLFGFLALLLVIRLRLHLFGYLDTIVSLLT